jgi:hypothetical protein
MYIIADLLERALKVMKCRLDMVMQAAFEALIIAVRICFVTQIRLNSGDHAQLDSKPIKATHSLDTNPDLILSGDSSVFHSLEVLW